jgi:hypothetical protein
MTTSPARLPVVLVSLAAGLALVTGCSGGSSGSKSSVAGGGGAGSSVAGPGPTALPAAKGAARTLVQTRSVIKTGDLALTNPHLSRVRREVDALLAALDGTVDREQTTNDRHGAVARSTLVIRVPADRFETARHRLARLGRVTSSTESARDVTTQVIDVDERVQTLSNSLDRLQRFQRSARTARDLIRYEDQITERQAELRSLKSQQSYLTDRTSLSTLTLRLSRPVHHAAVPGALDGAGFLAGLRSGWHALAATVVVAVTGLGAALPFLLLGAVLGVPALLWVRSRRATTAS